MKRVEVEWTDSGSWSGWRSKESAEREAREDFLGHRSCGYVLYDNEQGICLVQSMTDDKTMVADVLLIPRVAINKVKVLR